MNNPLHIGILADVMRPSAPDPAAVKDALARITASAEFTHAPRMSRFLRFVVEETLAGRDGDLKEYVVGVRVFDKAESYDPAIDPTVRAEASKLRARLARYYENDGLLDPVAIDIPKGAYRAQFRERTNGQPVREALPPVLAPQADPERAVQPSGPIVSPRARRWLGASLAALILLAAGVLAVLRFNRASQSDPRILRVTAWPGLEGAPSLSPDGNWVVFSWSGPDPDGAPDLWIKAVDSDAQRRLTETPVAEGGPAWSPDGRDIAFLRGNEGVFVVSFLGGNERHITTSGTVVGWTPDSQSLLVRDRASNGTHEIARIELASGTRYQITRGSKGIGDYTFDVSPDGATLAFVRYDRPGISDLYTVPLAGGEPRRLTDWNGGVTHVAWSPDGRAILYSVRDAVFSIEPDSKGLARGRKVLHTGGVGLSTSRPAPGRPVRLAFVERRVDVGMRLIDLDAARGDAFKGVSQFADSTRVDIPGRFSRDGKRVAFISNRTGQPEVYVANSDGSGVRQLTTLGKTELIVGDWDPDDRRLVIDTAIDGNSDIYVIPVDRPGDPVRLTDDPGYDGFPHWSADGRWIYFTSLRSGMPEVWKVSADGGDSNRVTSGVQPQERPDGQALLYLDRFPSGVSGTSSPNRLMSIPLSGGQPRVVLERAHLGLWSVVHDGIVFLTIESDADALDFYGFRDQKVRRLGKLPFRVSRVAGYGHLTVSRDGRWALINTTDLRESDIMVADGVR